MPKMSHAGDHQCEMVFLAVRDGIVIPDGTTRLDVCRDTGGMPHFNAIVKGKESITSHHRAFEVKIELF
jgi:hypothetical protein